MAAKELGGDKPLFFLREPHRAENGGAPLQCRTILNTPRQLARDEEAGRALDEWNPLGRNVQVERRRAIAKAPPSPVFDIAG